MYLIRTAQQEDAHWRYRDGNLAADLKQAKKWRDLTGEMGPTPSCIIQM